MTRNLFLDFSPQLQPCTTQPARYVHDSQSRRVCWSLVTCMDELIFRVMQGSSRHQRLYNTSLVLYYRSSPSSIKSPDLRGRGVCLWSVLNCRPTCVCKRNMTRVPFGEQRARPTDCLGCDANATGVLYTPYMCTALFLRLCCMAQSMEYYLKF